MTPDGSAIAYLRTKVLTASPEQLRLMLLDGAIKFLKQGREGLERKDYEASFNGLSQSRNIILELCNSVRPEVAPDLCERVRSLYTYMYVQLVEASHEKDSAKAGKILDLLEYERETWVLAMEKAAAERAGDAPAAPDAATGETPASASTLRVPVQTAAGAYRPLSVQG